MERVEARIHTVRTLLEMDLAIPAYQRPYKWQAQHVDQLLDDLHTHQSRSRYRLGTVVLHRPENGNKAHDIVDGQQRLLTLTLICHVLNKSLSFPSGSCQPRLLDAEFGHPTTQDNLRRNACLIESRLGVLSDPLKQDLLDFLLSRCELVCVSLEKLSEAFQFFDSQNARGKALAPQDLLKAFHLREMRGDGEESQRHCVRRWEAQVQPQDDTPSLDTIIGEILFRIRRWSRGQSGIRFSRRHLNVFKGVALHRSSYRHAEALRAIHFAVERYNADPMRAWDGQRMEFPFSADQVLPNGRRFFDYIQHYTRLYMELFVTSKAVLKPLLDLLDTYEGQHRIGDQYVRNLFECTLLYYFDRFGDLELKRVSELCFQWSYSVRLRQARVAQPTVDNVARDEHGLFHAIRKAVHPHEVLAYELPQPVQMNATLVEKIADRFTIQVTRQKK